MSGLNTNSVEPDQMLCSVASELGLHCLPMSHLWDARLKWVNSLPNFKNLNNPILHVHVLPDDVPKILLDGWQTVQTEIRCFILWYLS